MPRDSEFKALVRKRMEISGESYTQAMRQILAAAGTATTRAAARGGLKPDPRHYEVRGRAAEIAQAFGSKVVGAEHLFLAMLHDGRWPVSVISHMVDLGQAEAAVLGILNSPGYSPPPRPRPDVLSSYGQPRAGQVAREMGDSSIGVVHVLLAMIRDRETVPARVLADLADLDELEAAVLAAKNAAGGPPEDAVFLPEGHTMDGPLRQAVVDALPQDTTFRFSDTEDGRTWMQVLGPGGSLGREVTREVLKTALGSLGRPA